MSYWEEFPLSVVQVSVETYAWCFLLQPGSRHCTLLLQAVSELCSETWLCGSFPQPTSHWNNSLQELELLPLSIVKWDNSPTLMHTCMRDQFNTHTHLSKHHCNCAQSYPPLGCFPQSATGWGLTRGILSLAEATESALPGGVQGSAQGWSGHSGHPAS